MVDTGIDGMNNQNNMGVIEQTVDDSESCNN